MSGAEIAAAIAFKVEDEVFHALCGEFLDCLVKLLGGTFGETRDGDEAHFGSNHIRSVDAIYGYVVADYTELDELGRIAAFDFEIHLCAFFAAESLEHV